ncbi:MAG: LytTR family DNA-binding domain-containing protein [Defluviitaleaceae bacterium]|nr:LytTR family DNA-binding domain-containing protein [Defluviitaleaceae bacterium]MCL2275205.1 LytTR family DNA-binding domain-containing protein [Defluviitaleaceae bacterium]
MALFVAICDDEKNVCADLECILIDFFTKIKIKHEIDVYYNGEDFVKNIEKQATQYNVIFLDIEFTQSTQNGVSIGKQIRETYHENVVSIIYISWQQNYAMSLFDIRPFHFLIKPLTYEAVAQVMQTYLSINDIRAGEFIYKIGHDTYKVKTSDIVYVQAIKRKNYLYMKNGKSVEFYGTLKDIYEEQLRQNDFLFVHAAYVVNYDYIEVIKYDEVILNGNAAVLPISQRKLKEVREAYYAIIKRRRGVDAPPNTFV